MPPFAGQQGQRRPHSRPEQGWVFVWASLLWRVLLALMITPVMGQASATATSSSSFFSALTDPRVTLILIPPDNFALIPEQWAVFNRTHPYVLDRDLVIRSAEPPELGQMDFVFLMRKVLVAPNMTLTLDRLVLRNVNKLGGFGLDFFMGDKDSVIKVMDSVRVKLVCPPLEQSLQAARAFSAPEGFPPNEVLEQDGVCVLQNRSNKLAEQQRQCFDYVIQFREFTLQVGTADPEAGTAQPGYLLSMHNSTRVCLHYLTAECIQQQSEDTCTAQLLSQLLAPKTQADNSWQPQTIAGVVVGGVVGFLAVCCLAGVLLWKHRRWWHNGNGNGQSGSPKDSDEENVDPLVGADSTRQLKQQLLPPGPGGKKPDPSQAVKLGPLLGSGSFGRVFKGRWHGMDVAVKIMDPCNPDTLPRVLKEAEVMMTLEHQNVVKAYQCSVWSKKQQEQMAKAAGQRTAKDVSSPRMSVQRKQQPAAGRHSSGSGTVASSTTASSQAASSSSTAGGLHSAAAGPVRGTDADSVVIDVVPQIIPRRTAGAAAAAAGAAAGPLYATSATSSSSNAAGTFSSSSSTRVVPAPHSSGGESAAGSSASAARRLFAKLWQHPQDLGDPSLQGPPTASSTQEHQLRLATTPLSSAAHTLSGSSSMGAALPGSSGHTAAGVISSTHEHPAWWPVTRAAGSQGGRTISSGSTGAGTSGALSSGGHGSSSSAAAAAAGAGEIQPAPSKPVMGWLRRGRRSDDAADAAQASDSGSSKQASPVAAAAASSSSGSQPVRDELQVWLVLELCTGGSLKDAVTCGRIRSDTCQDMAKLLSRLLDAANGLAYLHSQGVVHGDLKAANVLLQHSGHGMQQVAKVCDFGVSTRLLDGDTHRSTTSLGTITHCAPEVLRSGHVSKAADVYAYGMMMWEVFTNQTAHAGCHSGAVVERVVLRGERPPVPPGMPPQYALLMQRCWDEDASKRPTFEQVVACLELLLDNLTSSESEGRISEGVEEERTSSSVSASDTAGAGKAAAAAVQDLEAAGVPGDKPASASGLALGSARTPSASSSGTRGLLRFLSKGSSVGAAAEGQPSGKGLAESVEGSSDWLSGPSTPGFNIRLEQLRGLRQWYLVNGTAPDPAEGEPQLDLELAQGNPAGVQATPSYSATRLQPWLDQCVDALAPQQGSGRRSGSYSRRWWKLLHTTAASKGSAAGSSVSQQPCTPRQSGGPAAV